jgi:hypothetical protein
MSSVADIKLVWVTNVWQQDEIRAYSDKIFDYDLLIDAESQQRKVRVNKYVDLIIYKVLRSPKQYELAGNRLYKYEVVVSYYTEKRPSEEPRRKIEEFFETLDEIIGASLRYNWGGTVTRMVPSPDVLEIDDADIGDTLCLVGQTSYTAEKHFTE